MQKEIDIKDAIELIFLFLMPVNGALESDVSEYSGMRFLVEEKGVDLDNGVYKLNKDGMDVWSGYIGSISADFIDFFKSKNYHVNEEELYRWVSEKYYLDNRADIKAIVSYILSNLTRYDYEYAKHISGTHRNMIEIRKLPGTVL